MKSKFLSLSTIALAAMAFAAPAFADGGAMGTGASIVGSTTAMIVDVPEGVVIDSLVRGPYNTTKGLAEAFGDENGWKQTIVGAVIGIPTGFVIGIPYGAFSGLRHGAQAGWDKPFSADSFVVGEGK